MLEIHKLNDKDSFDNYLDYKDGLECKYTIKLGTEDKAKIFNAVLDEMKEKKLISDYFYNNQKETMSFMDTNDSYKDYIYLFLGSLIITVGLGYMGIIVYHEMEQLGNNSLSEL